MSVCRGAAGVCAAVFVTSVASGSGRPGAMAAQSDAKKSTRSERGNGPSRAMGHPSPGWPRLHRRLSEDVSATLEAGIRVARKQLRGHLSCRGLFASLGADGVETLNGTSYYPASARQERKYCHGGNVAITTIGGSDVVLCRDFARLSGRQAAIILIHEALHFAGLTEYPVDPQAPDAVEITRTVMKSCGLGGRFGSGTRSSWRRRRGAPER